MEKEVVMQEYCIYCKKEQYSLVVYPVSHGEMGCAWCKQVPPVFTSEEEYTKALEKPVKKQ